MGLPHIGWSIGALVLALIYLQIQVLVAERKYRKALTNWEVVSGYMIILNLAYMKGEDIDTLVYKVANAPVSSKNIVHGSQMALRDIKEHQAKETTLKDFTSE